MRAVTFHGPFNLKVQDVEDPKIQQPKDVIIKVTAAGPLGEAIVAAARNSQLDLPDADGFEALPGQGLRALVEGKRLALGNVRMMQSQGLSLNGLSEAGQRWRNKARHRCTSPSTAVWPVSSPRRTQ